MKMLFAIALGLAVGCASTSSSSARAPQATAQADSSSCQQITATSGAVVYSSPDSNSAEVTTLKGRTSVCADPGSVGFGFRHVKLSNGKDGYISENDLLG